MRILFISDNPIHGFGGGSIENRKHYDALKHYCVETGNEFKVISRDDNLDERFQIDIQKNKFIDILTRLMGHSSYLYYTWIRNRKAIDQFKPDIIYLGRSRFGFIAKGIRKNNPHCIVVTNIDNVEVDYVDGYFSLKEGVINNLYKSFEKHNVRKDETDAIEFSDRLIYLTQRNVARVKELYNHCETNPIIIPICLEKQTMLYKKSSKKTVLFVGSLDYAANILAANRLIELWKEYFVQTPGVELIVAGRNPSKELLSYNANVKNISVIPDFEALADIIPQNSLMLAPIEKGAGMKVKVAETLSMGLMIAASDEALVGYEDAIKNDKINGIVRANTKEEYIDAIRKYLNFSDEELDNISKQNKKLYQTYYTYSVSRSKIKKLLDDVLEG